MIEMPLTSISRTTDFRKVSLESGRDFKTLNVFRRRKFSLASTTRVLVVADETAITKRHIKTHQLSLKQSLASLFDNRMVMGTSPQGYLGAGPRCWPESYVSILDPWYAKFCMGWPLKARRSLYQTGFGCAL